MHALRLLKEPWPRIIGIPLVALLICSLAEPGAPTFRSFLVSLSFTTVLWNGDYFLIIFFRRRYQAVADTPRRVILSIICICIFNLTADFTVCKLLAELGLQESKSWFEDIEVNLAKNFGITLLVGTLYEAGYFFERWRLQTIEVEQIKTQQLKSELNVLKNQISPHFLFNSLNTLVHLIHENPDRAVRFTEKLSHVYRYILQHKDQEVVPLATELEFTNNFIFLMKMRFEDSLHFENRIDAQYSNSFVAPLTLQMLVENAVKHNVVSHARPLHVTLDLVEDRYIEVRNNLQRKKGDVGSLKTGLDNIRQRYKYLSNLEVEILDMPDYFAVRLPLIHIGQRAIKELVPA